MNVALVTWLVFRTLRWLSWIGFFGVALFIQVYRDNLLTQFGHLPLGWDVALFGLSNAAVFMGFLELMMRERAGLPRPTFGRLIPTSGSSTKPN
jgi:hypothetical protein